MKYKQKEHSHGAGSAQYAADSMNTKNTAV